ncbi:hypothetical protein [Xanthomonas translucens]|uniref:hypothetical protein n=1 Tax=Xanthomonas campestris pv. translucens TaxID=343 RepID=UPI000A52030F|nr:hypothetical protein [Xanthomonas translucens]WLA08669.1 hypothetical protein MO328_00205 [Xanthomonas translucens]
MPITARRHFDQDISRALTIHTQASAMGPAPPDPVLKNDLLLSAVAMSVGAMDAYLCDAFVDCLTAALRSYRKGTWTGVFPSGYATQNLPAGILLTQKASRPDWAIRMAARKLMERQNILSISLVDDLFNPILPPAHKLWLTFIQIIIAHNRTRLTKHTTETIAGLAGKPLEDAKKQATAALKKRIGAIVQDRHDWIHNCARPKSAIKQTNATAAKRAIDDIKLFITTLDDHVETHRRA